MRFVITLEAEADNLDAIAEFAQAVRDDATILRHAEQEHIAIHGVVMTTTHERIEIHPSTPGLRLSSEHPGGFAYRPAPVEQPDDPPPSDPIEDEDEDEDGTDAELSDLEQFQAREARLDASLGVQ